MGEVLALVRQGYTSPGKSATAQVFSRSWCGTSLDREHLGERGIPSYRSRGRPRRPTATPGGAGVGRGARPRYARPRRVWLLGQTRRPTTTLGDRVLGVRALFTRRTGRALQRQGISISQKTYPASSTYLGRRRRDRRERETISSSLRGFAPALSVLSRAVHEAVKRSRLFYITAAISLGLSFS